MTWSVINDYRTTGTITSGISIDESNPGGGTALTGWTLYDDANYDSFNYQPACVKEILNTDPGNPGYISWAVSGDAGKIYYQYATSSDGVSWSAWSAAVDAKTTNYTYTDYAYIKYRTIFYPLYWVDTDAITFSSARITDDDLDNMQFISSNHVATTTSIIVNNGTSSVADLIDRNPVSQFTSVGDDSDLTTTSINVTFGTTVTVDRIIIENFNAKSFKMYYNSNSSDIIPLLGGPTTSAEFSNNSETSLFLRSTTKLYMTSFTIEMTATMAANEEKKVGQLRLSNHIMSFEINPNKSEYQPKLNRKQVFHNTSDGGTVVSVIADRWECKIKRKYVSATERTNLKSIYDSYDSVLFVPFPTSASWDGFIYDVNWKSDWDFDNYTENIKSLGYSGNIQLAEVPR